MDAECAFEDCDKPLSKKNPLGLCSGHATQHYSGIELRPLRRYKRRNGDPCEVDGCGEIEYQIGLCGTHFLNKRNNGDPLKRFRAVRGESVPWLRSSVLVETDDCVLWPYGRYSALNIEGVYLTAPQASLVLTGRPRPDPPNHFALHSCPAGDNPRCVNPRHLRWGSNADNMRDLRERRRHLNHRLQDLVSWLDEHGVAFPDKYRPN